MSSEGLDKPESPGLELEPLRLSQPPLLVLHINDSTDDQVIFQTACKRAGVPVQWHVAESAERGISYLDSLVAMSRKESVRWPDLVILDLILPGLSGLAVLEHIRKSAELQLLPVVVLTAQNAPELVEQALKLGANSFHAKPTDFAAMVDLVRTLYKVWSMAKRPQL
jgi:CheY-like chemotaxis protein